MTPATFTFWSLLVLWFVRGGRLTRLLEAATA